jgi:hypothetical protein
MFISVKDGCSRDQVIKPDNLKKTVRKNSFQFALLAACPFVFALAFTGCWTPPNANVQPAGKPGLIQGGIPVDILQYPVTVETLDASQRTIMLKNADGSTKTFYISPAVNNLDQIKIGDVVKATVKAELSVYILDHGQLPNADGTSRPKTINFNAKVLKVDPSYRLLTLQFTNGHNITIKAGLNVQLEKMAPGDDVVMRSNQVTAIEIKKP